MQREIDEATRRVLWLERLAWNAAAGALVAVMLLFLLWSLRWLDQVAPRPAPRPAAVAAAPDPGSTGAAPRGSRPIEALTRFVEPGPGG